MIDAAISSAMCAWCDLRVATMRVVGTDACATCGKDRHTRVRAALQRWKRNKERR